MDTPTHEVDGSRPFRSVKEAVAIFGDRLFLKGIQSSPKQPSFKEVNEAEVTENPDTPAPENPTNLSDEEDVGLSLDEPSYSSEITQTPIETPNYELTPTPSNPKKESHENIVHGNDLVMILMVVKKLEVELQETKTELKLLKERGSETEMALASLNAELHKRMSKIAKAEADADADAAGKGTAKSITTTSEGESLERETKNEEKTIRSELMVKNIDSPTLAQILSISDYEGYHRKKKSKTKKSMKKKPIVPLVTDLCIWNKKESPIHSISGPLFSKMYFT